MKQQDQAVKETPKQPHIVQKKETIKAEKTSSINDDLTPKGAPYQAGVAEVKAVANIIK